MNNELPRPGPGAHGSETAQRALWVPVDAAGANRRRPGGPGRPGQVATYVMPGGPSRPYHAGWGGGLASVLEAG